MIIAERDYQEFCHFPNDLGKIQLWHKFLNSYSRCWNAIAGEARTNSDLGRLINTKKSDELLIYLENSRNQLEHSPTTPTAGIRLVIDRMIEEGVPPPISIRLLGEDEFGERINISPEFGAGFSAETHHEFTLNEVVNRQERYPRPQMHNGVDISQLEDEKIGQLAIDFLKIGLAHAKKNAINKKRKLAGLAPL